MNRDGFVEHTSSDLEAWAQAHFGGAALKHVPWVKRAVTIGRAFATRPGKMIPQLFDRGYDIKAAYTFMQDPRSTPDAIEDGHRQLVKAQAARATSALFIEDDTDISFTHREQAIPGLGSIGRGEAWEQGFALHTVLAVAPPATGLTREDGKRAPVRVLGVADQQYEVYDWPKAGVAAGKKSKVRSGEPSITKVWARASQRLGPAPEGAHWVRVADREADLYDYLASCLALGHHFRVRARHNRVLVDAVGDEKLLDRARRAESLGRFTVELRARPRQTPREAIVEVSSVGAVIRAPQRPGGAPGTRDPIAVWVVRAWEAEPPEGGEGLEWFVLCDEAVEGFEAAREVVAQYATRWLIEEYHKGLKTGLGAERLQMEEAHQLFATIAVMSIVALRLLELREAVRRDPDEPAERSGLSVLEIEILRVRLGRSIESVRDVALALGRLGGHMNRKGDGPPGWVTLWRGMAELRGLVEGVRLARLLDAGG